MDYKQILANTLAAIKSVLLSTLGSSEASIINIAQNYIVDGEDRLAALLEAMSTGSDIKFMLRRLSDEKNILLGQLLSLEVVAKGIAESAVNNAQSILLDAIKLVLPSSVTIKVSDNNNVN